MVANARRRAGLTQRELAERAGVPQSTVGRIEGGATDPRSETLIRLLRACGEDLEALPRIGIGVDRTLARGQLATSMAARISGAAATARNVERFRRGVRFVDGRN